MAVEAFSSHCERSDALEEISLEAEERVCSAALKTEARTLETRSTPSAWAG